MGATMAFCIASEDDEGSQDGRSIWDTYDVGEKLGSGNFGEVRACRRRDADRDKEELAVKIVDRQSASVKAAEAFQSAEDELDIMAGIHHPHVVELKEVFQEDRYLYVVMERIDGGELFKAISDRRAVIVEDDIARIGQQLLEALDYLHGVGVVHRDIKAQNILLTEPPQVPGRALETAGVKLIDFGLAARLRQECLGGGEPQLDLVCGTPAMCAPEIWASQDTAPRAWKRLWGGTYGPKVDVWATGVVLYMALLGKLPFMEKQALRLATKVCDPYDEPSFEASNKSYKVSPGCTKFLRNLLEKDQHKRPSAGQACKDGWLGGRGSGGGRRSRALRLTPIPQEVREAALEEAEAAASRRMPLGGFSVDELQPARGEAEVAERSRAFEAVRAEATATRATARSRPLPSHRHPRADPDSDSSADSEEGDGRGAAC